MTGGVGRGSRSGGAGEGGDLLLSVVMPGPRKSLFGRASTFAAARTLKVNAKVSQHGSRYLSKGKFLVSRCCKLSRYFNNLMIHHGPQFGPVD